MDIENNKSYKPDWTPDNHGDEFAIRIVKGVENRPENLRQKSFKRKEFTTEELVNGVLEGNRILLAKTITLIESTSQNHQLRAKEVLTQLLPHSGKSLRIGISGVPGAGKSTLIEALGVYLINLGHKVAVLTIDPSS
nr:methylmalonyl Co-A mutase-associated GTPase MeaB [Ignavibacteriaceae bacterium]